MEETTDPFTTADDGDEANISLKATDTYELLTLMAVGAYMVLIAYFRHPQGIAKWTMRLHYALVGFGFGVLAMSEFSLHLDTKVDNATGIWVLFGVPMLTMVVVTVFYYFGIVVASLYVFLLLGEYLIRLLNNEWAVSKLGVMTIEGFGFFGAIAILMLVNTKKIYAPFMYLSSVCGMCFLVNGVGCYFDIEFLRELVMRPLDGALAYGRTRERPCANTELSNTNMTLFMAIVFAGGIVSLVLQLFTGWVLHKVVAFKAKVEALLEAKKRLAKEAHRQINYQPSKSKLQNLLWHYIRHRGEYLSFEQHQQILTAHLQEYELQARNLDVIEPDPDSLFVAAADQLTIINGKTYTPEKVRAKAVQWLENKENWQTMRNLEDDLFNMKKLKRKQYCRQMAKAGETWGDFLALQAIVQRFGIEANIVTSTPEPPVVHFSLLPEFAHQILRSKQKKHIKQRIQDQREIDESFNSSERYVLVGSDGKKVVVDRFIAEQSAILKQNIEEARALGTNQIRFGGRMTSVVLSNIVQQLEAQYLIKMTAKSREVQRGFKILGLEDYFGAGIGQKNDTKAVMLMSHYWGYHFGSLERAAETRMVTELAEADPRMSMHTRPYITLAFVRGLYFLFLCAGMWWLWWMCLYGDRFTSFGEGVAFILFWSSECINYLAGLLHFLNFWNPIQRRWKSLNRLDPAFTQRQTVNVVISHCNEDVDVVERTLTGALRMRTTPDTELKVWIAEDSFWNYAAKPTRKSWWDKFKESIKYDKPMEDDQELESLNPVLPSSEKYVPFYRGEEACLDEAKEKYKCLPRKQAQELLLIVRKTLYRYYSEKFLTRIDVGCEVNLVHEEELMRTDCARATMNYKFFAHFPNSLEVLPGPTIVVAARVKPETRHHGKAGNHNNVLFNVGMSGEFVMFLDYDMKPKREFLLRTLPWFYLFSESKQKYKLNRSVGYVQTNLCYKDATIAGEGDHLGARNTTYFKAVQQGRDGEDMCMFCGTNVIGRLAAFNTIGGIPYGSSAYDANTALKMHSLGYRSIHVDERLAVGMAPITVASAMHKRAVRAKGLVQLFLHNVCCRLRAADQPVWQQAVDGLESREKIDRHGIALSHKTSHNIFRFIYKWDNILMPFGEITPVFYVIVAFAFLVTGKPPLLVENDPLGSYRSFLLSYLSYFTFKFLLKLLVYSNVGREDVWVTQEVWWSYGLASFYGVIEGFKEAITGSGFKRFRMTEGGRQNKLEIVNIFIMLVLFLATTVKFIMFLLEENKNFLHGVAMVVVATIIFQTWPVVSTSLFELLSNAHLVENQKRDLKRYHIPKYIVFSIGLIATILLSQFFSA